MIQSKASRRKIVRPKEVEDADAVAEDAEVVGGEIAIEKNAGLKQRHLVPTRPIHLANRPLGSPTLLSLCLNRRGMVPMILM